MAAGGDASYNAIGPDSQVNVYRQTHVHLTAREVTWPLEIGIVPGLATAFQPRAALREQIDAARGQRAAAVLTQVLSGGGGVGKSQLAASYADEAIRAGTDLVVWANAGEVQQVVALYAQAAALVSAPGATGEDPERDARALLSWLATTDRRWLVVLDDVTDPAGMKDWWPSSRTGTGWVLATTRIHDARLTGNGRRRIQVDVYTPDEAAAYLRTRLTEDGAEHLLDDGLDDLAAALGCLPLALGHAAAYMLNQDLTCARYLALFNDSTRPLEQLLPEEADAEGYGRQIATTLLLSLDVAQHTEPVGLARPALRLAALLDPAGHPHVLWKTPAVLTYLTEQRAPAPDGAHRSEPVTAEQAEAVLRVLHRYALIGIDRRQAPHAVRVHALTARATREPLGDDALRALAQAAADALLDIWPDPDHLHPALASALRSNIDQLHQNTGEHLWRPEAHEILFHAGSSWVCTGLMATAIAYWKRLSVTSRAILGPEHSGTLRACANLANLYRGSTEAITLTERVVADCERLLGPEHHDTLRFRADLVTRYADTGRITEAVTLAKSILAVRRRRLGPTHPDTLTARESLGFAYSQAGRITKAITLTENVLAARERLLGPTHPDTLRVRANLAAAYGDAGRTAEAITLTENVLADRERFLGPTHHDTLLSRATLASAYSQVGRITEAIALTENVLAEREGFLGPTHVETLRTRNQLALYYDQAGRTADAITLEESVLADCERFLGPTHLDTLHVRANLATSYADAGRITEAITLAEGVLADRERLLGSEHHETARARHYLWGLLAWQRGQ
ncbi:tetratricopeptide repeat-containing protein [Streptomyces boluensis]|uniref:tetratricopeptide repeat-containing protein n=1 Tax=Streptomyces boluensis TaxID=1775135 RepID=UPI0028AC7724|nr:tetratricopeptide repeat-containing protein [Streptomyces boluensis]